MSTPASDVSIAPVSQAFHSDTIIVTLDQLLPVKAISRGAKAGNKYRQIAKSIQEIGLVEPPVIAPNGAGSSTYLLLDGHLRVDVLRDMGIISIECIASTDDEAFTYNKRINRLSPIQEQRMIAKAIERNVPKDKIARAP